MLSICLALIFQRCCLKSTSSLIIIIRWGRVVITYWRCATKNPLIVATLWLLGSPKGTTSSTAPVDLLMISLPAIPDSAPREERKIDGINVAILGRNPSGKTPSVYLVPGAKAAVGDPTSPSSNIIPKRFPYLSVPIKPSAN